jgi:hypothetical protein
MEELINTLKDPDECQRLADVFSELSIKARLRSVYLRAKLHGYRTGVALELARAIYAYEDNLSLKNKRKTHASRTWQMVKRYGIVKAAEKAVNRPVEAMGYRLLVERGMKDLIFENIIKKFPKEFSPDTVKLAKSRLEELENAIAL